MQLQHFDKLLTGLRTKVIPNLRRFPRMGRRYLDQPPQSAEALVQLASLPACQQERLMPCANTCMATI